ncbi:hypothetical protein SEA_KEELAN_135 [Gordonia phage Keelan]|nr:hypothetical protein SEA_KEELAN_135 [Gordonia phage Keelan]
MKQYGSTKTFVGLMLPNQSHKESISAVVGDKA